MCYIWHVKLKRALNSQRLPLRSNWQCIVYSNISILAPPYTLGCIGLYYTPNFQHPLSHATSCPRLHPAANLYYVIIQKILLIKFLLKVVIEKFILKEVYLSKTQYRCFQLFLERQLKIQRIDFILCTSTFMDDKLKEPFIFEFLAKKLRTALINCLLRIVFLAKQKYELIVD